MIVEAYRVTNCKVAYDRLWSGIVIKKENEEITDAIKRRLGTKGLLCELTNEGFDYDLIPFNTITLQDISIIDYLYITQKVDDLDTATRINV